MQKIFKTLLYGFLTIIFCSALVILSGQSGKAVDSVCNGLTNGAIVSDGGGNICMCVSGEMKCCVKDDPGAVITPIKDDLEQVVDCRAGTGVCSGRADGSIVQDGLNTCMCVLGEPSCCYETTKPCYTVYPVTGAVGNVIGCGNENLPGKPVGSVCYQNSECCTGFCILRQKSDGAWNDGVCGVSKCSSGELQCVTYGVNSSLYQCNSNGDWMFASSCVGPCKTSTSCDQSATFCVGKPNGTSCGENKTCRDGVCYSVETYDFACVEKTNPDGTIVPKPSTVSCSKNGLSGHCDGSGHCITSSNPGCMVNGVPQSTGVVCFNEQGANGTCDGQGNCVIGGGGGDTCYSYCQSIGKTGGVCANPYEGRPINYCSGSSCLINIFEPERSHIYCQNISSMSDNNCYCYNLQVCSPGCEQRCQNGQACKPISVENCCNDLDDDFDGMIDAQDSNCNSGTVNLQVGANNVCWKAKNWPHFLGSDSPYSYTSPTFACPAGYWIKPTGSYYVLDFEELYAIYSGPGGVTLPYGYGTGTQLPVPTGSLSGIFPANKLSLKYTAGGQSSSDYSQDLGVAVSSLECVQYANIECGKCGDGIFWGLFNICDKEECSAISGGACFFDQRGTGGHCYNKVPVSFTVKDAVAKNPVAGAKVKITDFENITCSTDGNGKCSLDLGLGGEFNGFISGENLTCSSVSAGCPKVFTVATAPTNVELNPYKVVACVDSDTTDEFPQGAKNYYQKGIASETLGSFPDLCQDSKVLKEYSCSNNKAIYETYTCVSGCYDGACLKAQAGEQAKVVFETKVVDKNGVPMQAVAAGVKIEVTGENWFDYCLTSYTGKCSLTLPQGAYQAYSSGYDQYYECNAAFGCPKSFNLVGSDTFVSLTLQLNPNNQSTSSCSDTDGGLEPDIYGAARTYYNIENQVSVLYDGCGTISSPKDSVIEAWCDGNFRATQKMPCAYGCDNGACKQGEGQRFKVSDKATSNPLDSALVKTFDGATPSRPLNFSCSSDSNGECPLNLPPDAPFYVAAEKSGYFCENDICCQKVSSPSEDATVTLKMRTSSSLACSKEGEKVYLNYVGQSENQCCSGLTQIASGVTPAFAVCTNCGDGICTAPENDYKCPSDCQASCSDCRVVDKFGNRSSCKTEEDCVDFAEYCSLQDGKCAEKDPSEVQQATLVFWVYDETAGQINKKPIKGAVVSVNPGTPNSRTCPTGDNGSCKIAVDVGKRHTIVVSAVGFETATPFFVDPSKAIEYPSTTYLKKELTEAEKTLQYKYQVLGLLGVPIAGAEGQAMLTPGTAPASTCLADAQGVCLLEMKIGNTYDLKFSKIGFEDTFMSYSPVVADRNRLVNGIVEPAITAPLVWINEPPAEPKCADTDGGKNYYAPGVASGIALAGGNAVWADSCLSGKVISEGYCSQSQAGIEPSYTTEQCTFGCEGGACKFEALFHVNGSDGTNKVPLVGAVVQLFSSVPGTVLIASCTTAGLDGLCKIPIVFGKEYIATVKPVGYRQYSKQFVGYTLFASQGPLAPLGQIISLEPMAETAPDCSACGDGTFNACDRDECLALGSNCVFDNFFIGLGSCHSKGDVVEEEGLATPERGGQTSVAVGEGFSVALEIPAGALNEEVKIVITTDTDEPADLPAGKVAVGNIIYDIRAVSLKTGQLIHNFKKPITIRITLSDEIMAIFNPATLTIRYYDSELKKSVDLPTTASGNTFYARTSHLSLFGLIGEASADVAMGDSCNPGATCCDSDNGYDPFNPGTADFYLVAPAGTFKDKCGGNILTEYGCFVANETVLDFSDAHPVFGSSKSAGHGESWANNVFQVEFTCLQGCLPEGKCKGGGTDSQPTTKIECFESDNGFMPYTKGDIFSQYKTDEGQILDSLSSNDGCSGDVLTEWSCKAPPSSLYIINTTAIQTNDGKNNLGWRVEYKCPGGVGCATDEGRCCNGQTDVTAGTKGCKPVESSICTDPEPASDPDCQFVSCDTSVSPYKWIIQPWHENQPCGGASLGKTCQSGECKGAGGTGGTGGNTGTVPVTGGTIEADPIDFGGIKIKPPSDLCTGICEGSADLAACQADEEYQQCINHPEKALMQRALAWLAWIAFTIAGVIILIGAFMVMTSSGDQNKVRSGKNMIFWAAIGLAVLLASRLIIGILEAILDVKIL